MANSRKTDLGSLQNHFTTEVTGFGKRFSPEYLAVLPAGGLSSAAAVQVYQRAYVARLTEALGETFEAVWRVLGDDGFFEAARAYISRTRSVTYNLSDYGVDFPEFLASGPGVEFPFLRDLARFELTFKGLFHAKQHEPIDPSHLSSLDQSNELRFKFGSAVALFQSPYGIYELWKRRTEPDLDLSSLDLGSPQAILLYKKGQKLFSNIISATDYAILAALRDGATLSKSLESMSAVATSGTITRLFQVVFAAGIIVDVQYDEKGSRS